MDQPNNLDEDTKNETQGEDSTTQSIPVIAEESSSDNITTTEEDSEVTNDTQTSETAPTEVPSDAGNDPIDSSVIEQAEESVAQAAPQTSESELAEVQQEIASLAEVSNEVSQGNISADTEHPGASEAQNTETTTPVADYTDTTYDQSTADTTEGMSTEPVAIEPESAQASDGAVSEDAAVAATSEDENPNDPMNQIMAQEERSTVHATHTPADRTELPEQQSGDNSVDNVAEGVPSAKTNATTTNTGLISDVVTPSAVAAAIADGTAGTNAITGTPEVAPTGAAATGASAVRTQNTKKGLLIVVVTLVTLLFGGAAVAAYMLQPKQESADQTNQSSQQQVVSNSLTTDEVDVSVAIDSLKALCSGGTAVADADPYTGNGVHPIAVYLKGGDEKFAQEAVDFTDATWVPDSATPLTTQLVACVSRTAGSEKKLKTCPITDATTKVTSNVDFYSSTYSIDVYESATGKKVTTFTNTSTDVACPTTAVVDKIDPKVFATYDLTSLEASLKTYVTAKI